MTVWDLSRIRYTVRKLTGQFDSTQLPDTSPTPGSVTINRPPSIDDYINDYYLYDMPEDLRTLRLRDFYTFTTVPNCGTYNVPQNVVQFFDPIYVDNYQFAFYQDPTIFYRIWPELNFIDQNLFTPNGTTGPFTLQLTQFPIQQGSVVVGLTPNIDGNPSPALETFRDSDQPIPLDLPTQQFFVNPGILISNLYTGVLPPPLPGVTPGTGTIDYLTGIVTISYINAPPIGTTSSVHYHPYQPSRPRDIMFWQQQLFLRPIPIDTYLVKLMSYVLPTTVLSAATNATSFPSIDASGNIQGFSGAGNDTPLTTLPQFNEWWQLVAYGAALKILAQEGDHEEYVRLKFYYDDQVIRAQRKTIKQIATQRIQTPYAENQIGGPAWPIFPIA